MDLPRIKKSLGGITREKKTIERVIVFTGPSTGLSLLLNVEQYEYLPGNKRGVGAKVTIHEPGHLTEVNQQGINVPVGKHTAMEIKQIKVGS